MVIPIHDKNPTRRTSVVNTALVLINVAVFVLSPLAWSGLLGHPSTPSTQCAQAAYTYHWGAIPKELLTDRPLTQVPTSRAVSTHSGLACVAGRPDYHKSPVLSVLTAMFVHAGWLHLLGNMLFLMIFGNNVEDRLGRLRYLLFYLASGYVAAYGYAALTGGTATTPLVGASGAIAGVLGAYLVLYPGARVWALVPVLFFIPLRLPAWLVLGGWFLIQWWYSAGGGVSGEANVAYVAHVVGFLFGLLVILLFFRRRRRLAPPAQAWPSRW